MFLRNWCGLLAVSVAAVTLPTAASGQPAVTLAPGTTLFRLDLSGTPIGEFPTAIKQTKGSMAVVLQGGVPMLKASAASEFLITLSQVLPRDFTLEFDLVPKMGSNPQDLSFEGTPTINQGTGSAHLLWHATGSLAVIGGGGENYETPMPEALRASLPGVLTHVVADFQGPTVKLYTNGQRHYTLDKQFARGRVLRVFLGGQDDGTEAVYLAGLRISTGSGLGIVAAQAGLPTRTQPPALPPGAPPATGSSSSGVTGTTSGSASTITTVGGSATQPIRTPASSPAAVPVNPPSAPSATVGPRPAGTTRPSAATAITQPPLITNLTATVGPLADNGCIDSWCPDWRQANGSCVVAWCPDWQTPENGCIHSWCPDWRPGTSARQVTWSWTLPAGVATAMVTFDLVAPDPTTGRLTTTRVSGNPAGLPSGSSIAVVVGTTLQICVAAQIDPSDPTKLVGETCLDTQVPGGSPAAPGTASQSLASTGGALPTIVSNVSVTQGTSGPVVNWLPVAVPAVYSVRRWKSNDAVCCNNASAPTPALTGPPWQDAQPQVTGTYVYEVTATMSGGVATGQTQFVVLRAAGSGPIATTVSATPLTALPATSPSGTITPMAPLPQPIQSGTLAPPPPPPVALTVAAISSAGDPADPGPGYVKVTWSQIPWSQDPNARENLVVRRWNVNDLNCCNFSSGPMGLVTALFDPLIANGAPPGTYEYEVTANLSRGQLQGRTRYAIPATAILAQPSATALPIRWTTSATAPTAAQAGLPAVSPPSLPAPISMGSSAPPPVSTYFTGTPAYVRVSWTMASGTPRGMLYNVERYLESSPACCVVKTNGLANIGWTDEATQWSGTYVYTITAVYPDGSTGSIQAKWVRPDPVNPTNFRATVLGSTVVLQWDPVPNVDWYELFGPALPYTSFQVVPPLTQFNVRNLAPGTYTWLVGSFYSSHNAPATVSTAAAAFPKVTVTVP